MTVDDDTWEARVVRKRGVSCVGRHWGTVAARSRWTDEGLGYELFDVVDGVPRLQDRGVLTYQGEMIILARLLDSVELEPGQTLVHPSAALTEADLPIWDESPQEDFWDEFEKSLQATLDYCEAQGEEK